MVVVSSFCIQDKVGVHMYRRSIFGCKCSPNLLLMYELSEGCRLQDAGQILLHLQIFLIVSVCVYICMCGSVCVCVWEIYAYFIKIFIFSSIHFVSSQKPKLNLHREEQLKVVRTSVYESGIRMY